MDKKSFEDYLKQDKTDPRTVALDLEEDLLPTDNIAELLTDEQIRKIAGDLVSQVEADDSSRSAWLERSREYISLALQFSKKKTFPFNNAANVKMPLLTQAALQFHARAYPLLAPARKPLAVDVGGYRQTDRQKDRAQRVSAFMNWQLTSDIVAKEENDDKLCLAVSIAGCMFKKTYHSDLDEQCVEDLLGPHEVIVNYRAPSILEASRVTHVRWLSTNDVLTKIREGEWMDFDPGRMPTMDDRVAQDDMDDINREEAVAEHLQPIHKFYEVHTYWDMDNDGYQEPYIILIHAESLSIPFIAKRYGVESVTLDFEGTVIQIAADNYFVKFPFISNPWGFYDIGLGALLGSLTKTASTSINQLLDSGTLNTALGGLVSRKLNLQKGAFRQNPFEFTEVNGNFDDIRKMVMFWPTKDPSPVLFNLLSLMINSGKEVANTLETQVGENPGQNQPLGTTRMVMEQGMKVFSAVFKRLWRAYSEQYRQIYKLNYQYLTSEKYLRVLGLLDQAPELANVDQIVMTDFNDKDLIIRPSANPNADAQATAMLKAQDYLAIAPNRALALREYLKATGAEELAPLDAWLDAPDPQPTFEEQLSIQAQKHKERYDWAMVELEAFKLEHNAIGDKARAIKALADAAATADAAVVNKIMASLDAMDKQDEILRKRANNILELKQQFIDEPQQQDAMTDNEEG